MAKLKVNKSIKENEVSSNSSYQEPHLLFNQQNYILVLVGIAFILVGFLLMAGGASSDPNVFAEKAIYSPRRITLAPILVVLGFIIEIYAIVKKPK